MTCLPRILEITKSATGLCEVSSGMAIDQDIRMAGDDVADYVEALADEYGEWVWAWPWERFAVLGEGLSTLFPIMLLWQLVTLPFRGSFEYPSPCERLELGHIAAVIDKGEWFDP